MEYTSLYGGHVVLAFDPIKHIYTANGEVVDGSISGALKVINKPALIPWAVKMAGDYLADNIKPGVAMDEIQIADLIKNAKAAHRTKTDSAADLGTMGHRWIQQYLIYKMSGEDMVEPSYPVNEQLRNIADTFLAFMANNDIEVIDVERKLYSRSLKMAGTADAIVLFRDKLAILDWKTGSGIYPEHFLQMGGYDICYTEEMEYMGAPVQPELHVIVNCSKTGDMQFAVSDKVERNKVGFIEALGLSRKLDEISKELKNA